MKKIFYLLISVFCLTLIGCEQPTEKLKDVSDIPGDYLFTLDVYAGPHRLYFTNEPVTIKLNSSGPNGATFYVKCNRTAVDSTLMLYNSAVDFYWAHSYVLSEGAAKDGRNQALNMQTTFDYIDGELVVKKNSATYLDGTVGAQNATINKFELKKK